MRLLSRQFQIARLFGIPLIIDYSWPPMALLHIWLVAQFWLPSQVKPSLPLAENLLLAILVTGLFFASVLTHELAHAFIARLEGIRIHDIQLHIFGGWARLVGEPRTALAEFRVAVAGPVSSFLLSVLFWFCLYLVQLFSAGGQHARAVVAGLLYLASANMLLAMFNLLPGLPLDGGRALRAILWHRRKDILSATRTTAKLGVGIAYMLISYGLFLLGFGMVRGRLWQDFLVAVWLLVVGIFLKNAAEGDYRFRAQQRASQQHEEQELAQKRAQWNVSGTVGAVMRSPAVSIVPELCVSDFIDDILAENRQTSFPVAREGRLHGILTLARLRQIPREHWERLAVSEVMEPISEDLFITVRASISHAEHKLRINSLGFLAVIDQDGMLVGCLSANDLDIT